MSAEPAGSSVGGGGCGPRGPSRRNAWGPLSYADLITQAISSAPERRLTLAQVYQWLVANVPWFSDKAEGASSAGWKNSVRHNLSLHTRFVKVQNEGTGKSCWWTLDPNAGGGRRTRRRCGSRRTRRNSDSVRADAAGAADLLTPAVPAWDETTSPSENGAQINNVAQVTPAAGDSCPLSPVWSPAAPQPAPESWTEPTPSQLMSRLMGALQQEPASLPEVQEGFTCDSEVVEEQEQAWCRQGGSHIPAFLGTPGYTPAHGNNGELLIHRT